MAASPEPSPTPHDGIVARYAATQAVTKRTGDLYRGAVIGTGAHRVMTRYLMRRIVRGA